MLIATAKFVSFLFVFQKIFGGHKSFLRATDTPVLDFYWRLAWVSKPGWMPRLQVFFIILKNLNV